MKIGHIKYKEIVSGYQYRIKPNAFLIEGKRFYAKLSDKGVLNACISDYSSNIYRPGIFKRIFVNSLTHGRLYLTAQAMMTEDPSVVS